MIKYRIQTKPSSPNFFWIERWEESTAVLPEGRWAYVQGGSREVITQLSDLLKAGKPLEETVEEFESTIFHKG